MSKNNRKERKVNTLSDLSTVVDRETLPVTGLHPVSDDQLPAETGAPETAEIDPEIVDAENNHGQDIPNDLVEPAVEPQPDPIDPPPAETEKVEEPVAAKEIPKAALELIEALQAQINLLKTSKASRKVASGSKARPNVTYVLLAKPPAWHSTPQVAQLQQILFDAKFLEAHRGEDGTVKVSEPELFAQVAAGHATGILRTRQEPVRIFQYYRSDLLNSNCLRWQ